MPAATPLSDADLQRVIALRHDLHRHPQLGFEETYAQRAVLDQLHRIGVEGVQTIADTGVVAWVLPSDADAHDRPGLAMRADLDALPITERTGLPYASKTPGLMHACGHDGHTAALVGTALALVDRRDRLGQPVKLLFQPAEEQLGGAKRMIEHGALTQAVGGFAADRMFGLHNWPGLPRGTIEILDGPTMAGTDRFVVKLTGTGGHAAIPHHAIDLPLATASLVQQLHAAAHRRVSPLDPAVLSVGRIAAGHAHNVLPGEAEIEGTIRFVDPAVRNTLHREMRAAATGIEHAFGCSVNVTIDAGYPPTVNATAAADHARAAAERLGLDVVTDAPPSMAAEDFSFYGQHAATAFAKLGADPPQRPWPKLHTDRYDFNDALLPSAIAWLTELATTDDG